MDKHAISRRALLQGRAECFGNLALRIGRDGGAAKRAVERMASCMNGALSQRRVVQPIAGS